MSFITALAKAYGGYGVGRQQNQQEQDRRTQLAQTASEQAANDAYRQQQLDQSADTIAQKKIVDVATLRNMGLDAQGNPLAPLQLNGLPQPGTQVTGAPIPSSSRNKAGQPVGPPAPGKTTTTPAWTTDQYMDAYNQAVAAGRPDLATQYLAGATGVANDLSKLSTANKNNAAAGTEISKQDLNKAHAWYFRQLPGIDLAKVNSAQTVARIHANATASAAATTANSRLQVARISDDTRLQAANLAGWYALNGKSQQEAVQLAIDAANNAEKFGQAQGAKTGDFSNAPVADNGMSMLAPILAALAANRGGGGGPGITLQMPMIGPDGKITYPGAGGSQQSSDNPHDKPADAKAYADAMAYDVALVKSDPAKRMEIDAAIDQVPMSPQQRAQAHAAIGAAAGVQAAPVKTAAPVVKPKPLPVVPRLTTTQAPPRILPALTTGGAGGTTAANRGALATDIKHAFTPPPESPAQKTARVKSEAVALNLIAGTPQYSAYLRSHGVAP